jgi:SPP1 family predicted phage head-tail adaptor
MELKSKYKGTERIGRMQEYITLQNKTETTNTFGERVESWSNLASVWANIEYRLNKSKETEEAGQETAISYVNFTIRKRTDVNEISRILHDSRYYDIEAISESNCRQYNVLSAKAVKP